VSPSCLLDSCVIYPPILCDTLLRLAENELYKVNFSQEILDGATRNLIKNGRFDTAKATRFQSFILNAFPEALVEVPQGLAAVMTNDPGDRHVLAAAVACNAEIIVTFNLKDFSPEALAPWEVEAQHPDVFLCELCELHGVETFAQIIQKQAEDRKRPETTVLELLSRLEIQVPNFARQITTKLHGKEVEATARKCIENFGKASGSHSRFYSGQIYNLLLSNGSLTITAKDGRGEILRSQSGNNQGILSPKDVRTFQKVEDTFHPSQVNLLPEGSERSGEG